MKVVFWVIVAIVLTVLFGTWPLAVISKIFDGLAWVVGKLAGLLDFFHWNGLLQVGL